MCEQRAKVYALMVVWLLSPIALFRAIKVAKAATKDKNVQLAAIIERKEEKNLKSSLENPQNKCASTNVRQKVHKENIISLYLPSNLYQL